MFLSFEYFSFHHRISGKRSDPYCSSENLFYLSSDQTFLSMSGDHSSRSWSYCATALHNQHYFSCNKDERKYSTLHLRSLWSFKRQFVRNICLDVDSRVTVDLIRRSWVRFPPRSKDFFFTSCGSLIPFTRANAQWVIHGFN